MSKGLLTGKIQGVLEFYATNLCDGEANVYSADRVHHLVTANLIIMSIPHLPLHTRFKM